MRAQLPLRVGLAVTLAVIIGCTEEEELIDQGLVPTAVSVDPDKSFLLKGEASCGPTAGAMQSFVAVFMDDGPEQPDSPDVPAPGFPFKLPASPPTPCPQTASFRYVVLGHRYWAEVDAYEQPASELTAGALNCDPTGAAGSRRMCTTDEGNKLVPVAPRWRTTCGEEKQAVAKVNVDVPITGCAPLEDDGTPGATGILVDPSSALGSLTCVDGDEGDVFSLSILPEGGALPDVTGIPCGAEPAPYDVGIVAGEIYRFRIEASAEEGGPAVWGASCFVVPKEGIVTGATCDPLTDRGSLTVDVDCPAGAARLRIVVEDGPEPAGELATVDCGEAADVFGVLGGEYELRLEFLDANQMEIAGEGLACAAVVPPGGSGTADCTL